MAIASVSQTAAVKGIDLLWRGTSEGNLYTLKEQNVNTIMVMGDRDRIQQLISNLLSNAVKFTSERGQIEVRLKKIIGNDSSVIYKKSEQQPTLDSQVSIAQHAQIVIADTGIGISAEFLPHVFDRFCQAEHSNLFGGLELGLTIARHLVELHNGTIQAESPGIGQGAIFTVNLPCIRD
jgi:signal transduction histidine kinase